MKRTRRATLRVAAAPAGRHLCRMARQGNPSSVRSGIFRPDGAWNLSGLGFYKDSAPDGAWIGCRTQTGAPIPTAPLEKQKAVERLVDRLLAAKQRDAGADTRAWEREIASQPRKVFPQALTVAFATGGDELAYARYGLTPEEKALVQAAAK